MQKPHILTVIIQFTDLRGGYATSFSARFETGTAAQVAGNAWATHFAGTNHIVTWYIFPEK